MKKLLITCLLATLPLGAIAKKEAFSILTKRCGETELRRAAGASLAKIVSEFNGKGLHGFIIELDQSLMTQKQLTQKLVKSGCYKEDHLAKKTKLLPEDLLSDKNISEQLFDTEDT